MAWQDRPYYRDRSSGAGNPLTWILTGSIPLFTAFGIRVRAHASMVLLIVFTLITSGASGGMGVRNAITFSTILFGIILLHEFGHCFAARWVGGDARDILMWPLGGLAFADAPNRAWPQFATAAGGPMVNVAICFLTAVGMGVVNWGQPSIPWNPLSREFFPPYHSPVGYYLWWIFIISWGNLLFNLLPIYPLDGGRLLHASLWFKLGYYRSTIAACWVGMIGSVLMAMYGLTAFGSWYGMVLLFLGISCFITCFQMRVATKAAGPFDFEDEPDYAASLKYRPDDDDEKPKHRKVSRRAINRARRAAQRENAERVHIDAILAKVSAHGMQSLTWLEKRALHKATERQRKRGSESSPHGSHTL